MLNDSTAYVGESKSQIQKAEWWLPGAAEGGNGGSGFNEFRVCVLQDEKSSECGWWCRLHNKMDVLNTTELYV